MWSETVGALSDIIPPNFVLYGEIIGWVRDAPIQKGYTYRIPRGEHQLYIYRVTIVNDGVQYDLDWDGMEEFCKERGLNVVPALAAGERALWFSAEDLFDAWADGRYHDAGYTGALPLADESPVDEGVCIRWDHGRTPTVLKIKGPKFLEHESIMLDKNVTDIEEEQN